MPRPPFIPPSEELADLNEYCKRWSQRVLCTDPADRESAKENIRLSYININLPPPAEFTWGISPIESAKIRQKREWFGNRNLACLGTLLDSFSQTARPLDLSATPIVNRCLSDQVFGRFVSGLPTLDGRLFCGPKHEVVLATRAFLYERCLDPGSANIAPLLAAIYSCGWWWWPLRDCVVLVERPSEIHMDESGYLHNASGAALVFRDGASAYYWHGLSVNPEALVHQPRLAVEIHRTTERRDELISLFGPEEFTDALERGRPVRMTRSTASPLLKSALPTLQELRSKSGPTPLYERYLQGECQEVWQELVAAGAKVREEPLVFDAVAVTVETMSRARRNVETLVDRLKTLKYRFLGKPFIPARLGAVKATAKLERAFGPMPLALRGWYELVGAVDFMGGHKFLNPRGADADATPDPLVVGSIEDALADYERAKNSLEYEDKFLIPIAPDELHKQGDSGGPPYSIAIPNPSVDGILLNYHAEATFVEYLRISFEWGAFPGWEGDDGAPSREIEQLRSGLLPL